MEKKIRKICGKNPQRLSESLIFKVSRLFIILDIKIYWHDKLRHINFRIFLSKYFSNYINTFYIKLGVLKF